MQQISSHLVNNLAHNIITCTPACYDTFTAIPLVDLSDPNAKTHLVRACQTVGFFKVTNHGISANIFNQLEEETFGFFELPEKQKVGSKTELPEKQKVGSKTHGRLGYGHKNIGSNGDMGWVEYLLFNTNPELSPPNSMVPGIKPFLWRCMSEYVHAVRSMTCDVLEMIGDALEIEHKLSEMVRDENSDSYFRLNYYPACPEIEPGLIGFGEHTDPQMMSVIRSNNTPGLQICLSDGTWIPVTPDETTFFFFVGDALQVMTNGRFRSVKHRVMAHSEKPRLSMIFFGAPKLDENIEPLVMKEGEKSLYKKFNWSDYITSAYKTKLGDNRLARVEISDDDGEDDGDAQ